VTLIKRRQCTRRALLAVAAGATALATVTIARTIRFNFTGSLPRGVYRAVERPLSRGDLVIACLPPKVGRFAHERGYLWRGDCPGGVAPVGKMVTGVAGDTVIVTAEGLVVNGHRIPNTRILSRDSRGRSLIHLPYVTFIVQPGELWLTSSHSSRSFDSRYFGPVPAAGVLSGVEPLWTFGH
jgi:conjugative transfer signal peptidase TraF